MDDPPARHDRDVFRLAPSMDSSVLQTIAARLEFRGTDEGYTRVSQAYFAQLPLGSARRILALGCGTGVEVRALKRLIAPDVAVVGIDHSTALIDVARQLTADEGLSENVSYETGDAHHPGGDDGAFDIVTLHTLLSHVEDPLQVLSQARRLVRPGGTVAVFDGDYASLTFAHPDHALATMVEERLKQVLVANPRVMRDMPGLLRQAGLELDDAHGELYGNIGAGTFWANAAESYGALLAGSGLLAADVVDDWRSFQRRSVEDGTFFGASNYYTYLARRPE